MDNAAKSKQGELKKASMQAGKQRVAKNDAPAAKTKTTDATATEERKKAEERKQAEEISKREAAKKQMKAANPRYRWKACDSSGFYVPIGKVDNKDAHFHFEAGPRGGKIKARFEKTTIPASHTSTSHSISKTYTKGIQPASLTSRVERRMDPMQPSISSMRIRL